ncbi:MAG TPA: ABC transporter substrate-binding protein [Ktedonobacterales bacterium]|nr:ABC transporter substrate-binding protein [Ktedonobacterales bacterium]
MRPSMRHPHLVFSRFPALLTVIALCCLTAVSLAACGASTASGPETPLIAKDANGTPIVIPTNAPQRIISLGATDSEILAALHVESHVVAVDYYTDYPADMAAKQKITDSSGNANVEEIIALQPDLVVSYGGETHATDLKLEQAHIQVVDLPALDLNGSLTEMRLLGQLVHAESAANALVASMQAKFAAIKAAVAGAPTVTVYMEVGYSPPPPFAYGGGSYGDQLIQDAGGVNIFHSDMTNSGYPEVSAESIIAANPQVIILTGGASYSGTPAQVAQRPGWGVISAVANHRVYTLNADIVQRPGPRLVDALEQIAKLLHPDRF